MTTTQEANVGKKSEIAVENHKISISILPQSVPVSFWQI